VDSPLEEETASQEGESVVYLTSCVLNRDWPELVKKKIEIAEICLALVSDSDEWLWLDAADLEVFSSDSQPDITVHVYVDGELPEVALEDRVFASEARNIYLDGSSWWLELRRPPLLPIPFSDQLLKLDAGLTSGELHISEPDPHRQPSMMFKILFQALWGSLLTLHRGVIVHASGVDLGRGGVLFVGEAGAGKTTMATLWEGHNGARVLHDDRIVVREKDGRFWAYPVPKLAEFGPTSSRGIPLERVFFIGHGEANGSRPRRPSSAVTGLLAESFVPGYDPRAVGLALQLLDDLVGSVPCEDLRFLPDDSAVDFVSALCRREPILSA
jgi:hypothetical protein